MQDEEQGGAVPRRRPWSPLVRWYPVARLIAGPVMLVVLVHEVRLRSLFAVWNGSTVLWLAAGVSCTTVALVLSAFRWHRVLAAMEIRTPLRALVGTSLASQFVSNFLPSTIGGDALRVSRVSSEVGRAHGGPERPAAFASVVVDRMSGWLVLPLLCLAGLVVNPALRHLGRSSRLALGLSLVALAALAVTLVVAANPRLGGRLAGRSNWLRFMGAVHLGLDRIRRRPLAAAQVIGVSAAYQLVIVVAGLLAARALGIHLGFTALLAFGPAVAIVQVVPVTVGGLGLREGAFALFLQPLGVPVGQAVALGLVLYAMHLLSSLIGAPSFAVGQRQRRVLAPVA